MSILRFLPISAILWKTLFTFTALPGFSAKKGNRHKVFIIGFGTLTKYWYLSFHSRKNKLTFMFYSSDNLPTQGINRLRICEVMWPGDHRKCQKHFLWVQMSLWTRWMQDRHDRWVWKPISWYLRNHLPVTQFNSVTMVISKEWTIPLQWLVVTGHRLY